MANERLAEKDEVERASVEAAVAEERAERRTTAQRTRVEWEQQVQRMTRLLFLCSASSMLWPHWLS